MSSLPTLCVTLYLLVTPFSRCFPQPRLSPPAPPAPHEGGSSRPRPRRPTRRARPAPVSAGTAAPGRVSTHRKHSGTPSPGPARHLPPPPSPEGTDRGEPGGRSVPTPPPTSKRPHARPPLTAPRTYPPGQRPVPCRHRRSHRRASSAALPGRPLPRGGGPRPGGAARRAGGPGRAGRGCEGGKGRRNGAARAEGRRAGCPAPPSPHGEEAAAPGPSAGCLASLPARRPGPAVHRDAASPGGRVCFPSTTRETQRCCCFIAWLRRIFSPTA